MNYQPGPQDQAPAQWRPEQPYQPQQPYYERPPQYAPVQPYAPQNVQAPAARFPSRAVTKERKKTSHGLHLVLTILTGGGWGLFVWLPLTFWHKLGPRRKVVTRYR